MNFESDSFEFVDDVDTDSAFTEGELIDKEMELGISEMKVIEKINTNRELGIFGPRVLIKTAEDGELSDVSLTSDPSEDSSVDRVEEKKFNKKKGAMRQLTYSKISEALERQKRMTAMSRAKLGNVRKELKLAHVKVKDLKQALAQNNRQVSSNLGTVIAKRMGKISRRDISQSGRCDSLVARYGAKASDSSMEYVIPNVYRTQPSTAILTDFVRNSNTDEVVGMMLKMEERMQALETHIERVQDERQARISQHARARNNAQVIISKQNQDAEKTVRRLMERANKKKEQNRRQRRKNCHTKARMIAKVRTKMPQKQRTAQRKCNRMRA